MSDSIVLSVSQRQINAVCAAWEAHERRRDHMAPCEACGAEWSQVAAGGWLLDHVAGCARILFMDAVECADDAGSVRPFDVASVLQVWFAYCAVCDVSPEIGEFPHVCAEDGCDRVVLFDDEPRCFTHSPDSGSSVRGWSALRVAAVAS